MTAASGKPVTTNARLRVLGRGLRARRGVRLTLRGVREAAGMSQTAVAESAHMDQGDISRLEARPSLDDCQLDTLGRYVAALGGQLELVARFGDKAIVLAGSEAADSPRGAGDRAKKRSVRKR